MRPSRFRFPWPLLLLTWFLASKYRLTTLWTRLSRQKSWQPNLKGKFHRTWEWCGQMDKNEFRIDTMSTIVKECGLPWTVCAPRLRFPACRRHCQRRLGWVVQWYIVWAGLSSGVWTLWIPYPTWDRSCPIQIQQISTTFLAALMYTNDEDYLELLNVLKLPIDGCSRSRVDYSV